MFNCSYFCLYEIIYFTNMGRVKNASEWSVQSVFNILQYHFLTNRTTGASVQAARKSMKHFRQLFC